MQIKKMNVLLAFFIIIAICGCGQSDKENFDNTVTTTIVSGSENTEEVTDTDKPEASSAGAESKSENPCVGTEDKYEDESSEEFNPYKKLQEYPAGKLELGERNEEAWSKWLQQHSDPNNTELNETTLSPIQLMSDTDAKVITGGKIVKMPEYYHRGYGSIEYGYLTPTGKLVYIDQFALDRLGETVDFNVNWGLYDHFEFNIRTDYRIAEQGTVSISTQTSDKTKVKYTLYVDFYLGEIEEFFGPQCYAELSGGTVVFDLGLTIENPEYSGLNVFYTVTEFDRKYGQTVPKTYELASIEGQTVYINDICREYPFDTDYEWHIIAEIKDHADNLIYVEEFTAYESYLPEENTFFITKGEKFVL
jgi:hypothetical protein